MANFTKNHSIGHQTLLSGGSAVSFADFAVEGDLEGAVAGDTIEICSIPRDALVQNVHLVVTEAFVGATSPTFAVADDAVTPHEFIAATAVDALGTTGAAPPTQVQYEYSQSGKLLVTLGGSGFDSATAGEVIVRMNYVQKGRSNEVHE